MSTEALDLKLSDEVLNAFDLRDESDDMYGVSGAQLRPVADAATAKAAWWIVDWLHRVGYTDTRDSMPPANAYAHVALEEALTAAGIEERPTSD